MRELKFRAWDSERKTYDHEELLLAPNGDILASRWQELCEPESEYIIEQYTGLKDKNGKEIYEGDILKDKDFVEKVWTCKVEYDDKFAQFYCSTNHGGCWSFEDARGDELEVIGNIHENPELIGKEK